MDAAETIAVIRDLFLIVFIGLGIIMLLVGGFLGFKLYRSIKRITGTAEEVSNVVLNQVVRPLSNIESLFSVLNEMLSRVMGMVHSRQSQQRRDENAEER